MFCIVVLAQGGMKTGSEQQFPNLPYPPIYSFEYSSLYMYPKLVGSWTMLDEASFERTENRYLYVREESFTLLPGHAIDSVSVEFHVKQGSTSRTSEKLQKQPTLRSST